MSMAGCELVSVMWHPLLFSALFVRWSQGCGVIVKSQHALLIAWLWPAEVRFLKLIMVSQKNVALILNANY